MRRALVAYPELSSVEVSATLPAAEAATYRVRAKLVASGGALGLFERGSHRVVDVPGCVVMRPELRAVAASLRAVLGELGGVTSVDLRTTDEGVLVTLALPEHAGAGERQRVARVAAKANPAIATVAISRREQDDPRVLGSAPEVLSGPAELRHTLEPGAPFHYASPGAFTQAHPAQASALHRAIEHALLGGAEGNGGGDRALAGVRVLELYAGSGALALRLARAGAELTLVESFSPAVELARRAAAEQGIELSALAGDAAVALQELTAARRGFDAVIANPPRRGVAPSVRRGIAALSPKLVLYVSCEPRTLARDAAHLAHLGYVLERALPIDMIPLSDAVETLALFRRGPRPAPEVRHESAAFRVIERRAHAEPEGASGLAFVPHEPGAAALPDAPRFEYLALVRGVIRAHGSFPPSPARAAERPPRVRYERREVVGGHSLIALFSDAACEEAVFERLAAFGHPVLGDARHGDPRSNAHFEHRHGLDRAFLHVTALGFSEQGQPVALKAPLPPDLARVLASLSGRA
ncbi:MAG TPA: RsmD family RNA methyltransferase [Polyangiaceae bacterium]